MNGSDALDTIISQTEILLDRVRCQMRDEDDKAVLALRWFQGAVQDALSDLRAEHGRALDRELNVPSDRVMRQMVNHDARNIDGSRE
jgi:hypothetical protein